MLKKLATAALATLALSGTAQAAPVFIDFEGQTNQCFWNRTTQLTTQYQALGVVFSNNRNAADGGAVIDQCGDFGFNARSGRAFVGYANDGPSLITMAFDSAISSLSLWGATTRNSGDLVRMSAFDSAGLLVDSAQFAGGNAWQELSVSGAGITKVTLQSAFAGAYDDLSFTVGPAAAPLPEPATVALVALALAGVATVRRRR